MYKYDVNATASLFNLKKKSKIWQCDITFHTSVIHISNQKDSFTTFSIQKLAHLRRPFGVADLDVEEVVEQLVDGLVAVEHEEELHHARQVTRLEQFTCKDNTGS